VTHYLSCFPGRPLHNEHRTDKNKNVIQSFSNIHMVLQHKENRAVICIKEENLIFFEAIKRIEKRSVLFLSVLRRRTVGHRH